MSQQPSAPGLPKRFYTSVTSKESGSGWKICLDGKALKSRKGGVLVVPTVVLADAIVAEWDAQDAHIDLSQMPMTRLHMSAHDLSEGDAASIREEIARYAASDLLCYRAEAPVELVRRQAKIWDPIIQSVEQTLGLKFVSAAGIVFQDQPNESIKRVNQIAEPLGAGELIFFRVSLGVTGSAILSLAIWTGLIDPEAAFSASRIDEEFQIEKWGRDAEAEQATARRKQEFTDATTYLTLARASHQES
ncbi:MAG: ATP12 family protein [Pseudomonadota bacterium]